MKKSFLLVIFIIGAFAFAQDIDDDFDSVFDDVQDITAEENDRINASNENKIESKSDSNFNFSGKMISEMGLIYGHRFGDLTKRKYNEDTETWGIVTEGDSSYRRNWLAGYFDFENHLSFVARADETFSIRGNLCSTFFPIKWINEEKSFLYFDYMAGPYCIVTAGKKNLNWGYVRIFNNVKDYSQKERLSTNIVADSESSVIGSMTFPLAFMTATGVILYDLHNTYEFNKEEPPKVDELSYAGSFEFYFKQASINIFGRRTARAVSKRLYTGSWYTSGSDVREDDNASGSENSNEINDPYAIKNVIGIEAKKTILNYDCYIQNSLRFSGKGNFHYEANYLTLGSYRIWEKWGYNAEFQNFYNITNNENTYRAALDFGVKNVGPKKDLKLAIQWRHDTNSYSGKYMDNCWVKFGLIKSNFFKHLSWVNGIQLFYRTQDNVGIYQARLASYFTLNVDY